jgi:DNA-binding winged helix-turn-helix (wHTH) protein/tetratricopeptide (TPR) repeat protein
MHSANRAIGDIELDLGRYELRRRGRRVKLEKKPMELLILLVARREQLVTRQDIVAKLWRSDLFIDTEPNINNIVRKIRAALGDNFAKPRFLETVVGKGYRFIGPLRVIDARFPHSDVARTAAAPNSEDRAAARGERTSLAILPLLLLGNLSDEQGVSLGFADALVARLGNLQGVDVLPTWAVLNVPADAPTSDIAARLGVRFVMRGAMQELKGRRRVSLEMFDSHLQRACFSRKCDFDVEEAAQHLTTAVTRDPNFSLAHATLSLVCATRQFELDPASAWLEKAEFHCRRALELDVDLPEGHVAKAFLLWGPSKNFQHLEAIAELRRALALQKNLPHAYNRLGTILAHVGLLDHAREMYERGRPFHPQKAASHSIVQVYVWGREYDLAREEIRAWRAESPSNKYPVYFAPQLAMMTEDWQAAKALLDEAVRLLPDEPLTASLLGVFYALRGNPERALECLNRACASPKSFGHAHHTYYQVACILALLERPAEAFEWLERSVSTGFACWPFFMKDPCLQNLRDLPEFEVLVSSLQAKYPDHLGLL